MTAPRLARIPSGFLVAIEGIDGAGKTTQATMLAGELASMPVEIVTSKEPTSGPWGDKIRTSASVGRMSAADELHAFTEDRREHVANLIRPALDRGGVVVLDRYYFSTAAYQGARGIDPAGILRSQETFAPRPDIIVIVKLDPELAIGRIKNRGASNEFETLAGLRAVDERFDELGEPYNIARIDGSRSPLEVHEVLYAAVMKAYGEKLLRTAASVIADASVALEDKAAALGGMLLHA